jgi:hypothetical protein
MMVRGENNAGRGFAGAWKRNWKRIAAGILVVILFSNEMNWADLMIRADIKEEESETVENENGGASDCTESSEKTNDSTEADSEKTDTESETGSEKDGDDTSASTKTESQGEGNTETESQKDSSTTTEDDAALSKIQEMIAALPDREEVTDDNAYDVYEQLDEIYNALDDELSGEQYDRLMEMDCWAQLSDYTDWFTEEYGELVSDRMSTLYATLYNGMEYTDGQGVKYTIYSSTTGFYAEVNEKNSSESSNGNITIPETICDVDVTSIKDSAFYGRTNLTSITIPASVTHIGKKAFAECTGLLKVEFAKDSRLGDIDQSAFNGCSSLTSITIPASVTSIGSRAFSECEKLGTVEFAEGSKLEKIGAAAFFSTAIKNITIPTGVTKLGNGVFESCGQLTEVRGNGIEKISGTNTFSGSSDIDTIEFDKLNDLENFLEGGNFGNTDLKTVILPGLTSTVENNKNIFENMSSLEKVDISGVTDITDNTFSACQGSLKEVNISGVETIPANAFSDFTNLSKVTISSATTIKAGAFSNCGTTATSEDGTAIGLDIDLSKVKTIEKGAFSNSDILRADLSSVEKLEDSVFKGCKKLSEVTLSDSITSISENTFNGCIDLTSVTLPDNLETIKADAFSNCGTATSEDGTAVGLDIDLSKVKTIESGAFSSSGLKEATLSSVESLGDSVFKNCKELSKVTLSGSITSIPVNTFNGCTDLTSVTLPDNLETIESGAFSNCGTATSEDGTAVGLNVDLSGAKTISGSAFSNSGLKSADLSSAEKIGDNAFSDCKQLGSVTLSDNLTSLGTGAFSGCTSLTAIDLPDTIKTIPESTFENCTGLSSVTITYGINTIGDDAFNGCQNMTTITIPITVTTIGENAFDNCKNLRTIECPCVFSKPDMYNNTGISVDEAAKDDKFENSDNVTGYFKKLHILNWSQGDSIAEIISGSCANGDYEKNIATRVKIYRPKNKRDAAYLVSNTDEQGNPLCNVTAELPAILYKNITLNTDETTNVPVDEGIYIASVTPQTTYTYKLDGEMREIKASSATAMVKYTITKDGIEGKDSLTVIADNKEMKVGDAIDSFTYKISGLASGANSSTIFSSEPTFKTNATDTGKAGLYNITKDNAGVLNTSSSDDYEIDNYKDGKLAITNTTHAWIWEVSEDNPAILIAKDCFCGHFADKDEVQCRVELKLNDEPEEDGSYKCYLDDEGTKEEFKAELDNEIEDAQIIYDKEVDSSTGDTTYQAYFIIGNKNSVEYNTGYGISGSDDKEYTEAKVSTTIKGTTPNNNYTSPKTALPDFAIEKILTKTYGDPPFDLTTVGLPEDAKETVIYTSSDKNILSIKGSTATILHSGTVTVTARYPGDSKYESAYASVTIEIKPAQLIVIANDKTAVRGSRMPTFTYYTNGLKNNDTFIGPTMTTTAKDTDTVGTYDINISGGAPSNTSYTIRYQKGTLLIVDEEDEPDTHNSDRHSGTGGDSGNDSNSSGGNASNGKNTGKGEHSNKGQTTDSKTKPSSSVTKGDITTSKHSEATAHDEEQSSDEQKSSQSSFIPSERGIIIINNLFFIFIIILLLIVILFKRKKKNNDESEEQKANI